MIFPFRLPRRCGSCQMLSLLGVTFFSVTRSASEIHVLTGADRRAKILFMYKALSFCVFENEQPSKQPLDQNEESHLSGGLRNLLNLMMFMAPEVGLEPTTLRLTAS